MKAKTVNENISFQRGKDPKDAMKIGQWVDGYRVDKYPDFDDWDQGSNDLLEWQDWNFDKKIFNENDISETEVTPDLEPDLYPLPVVTFKNYDELFGDWNESFPFKKIPFIANTDGDERSFLISPEGYNYPRWITELI